MPTLTIEYRDETERLALEQAIAYVAQLHQAALAAPDGRVLAVCEQLALTEGRALLRSTLAAAMESRIAIAEQKGGRRDTVGKRTADAAKGGTPVRS